MVTFPPHCSHRLQPLDVTVFGGVKNAYKKQHSAWMKANRGECLQIMHIPLFVKAALLKGATPGNIVSGRIDLCFRWFINTITITII